MKDRLLVAVHVLQRVLSAIAALFVLAVLALGLTAYLAMSGPNLRLLRLLTAQLGSLIAGQRTESLTLDVHLAPHEGRLTGVATMRVRSLEDNRQRFYFLLNDGLRLRRVLASRGDGRPQPVAAYQLSLLTVVDTGTPVAKDDTIRLTMEYDGSPSAGLLAAAAGVMNPQEVRLGVESFWYPVDAQSFFIADVTITLPRDMTLVHNGIEELRAPRGDLQQIRWTSQRPVSGIALVAGPYTLTAHTVDGIRYQVYLANDLRLDAQRVLDMMADANRLFTERFGSSGFDRVTLFVSRELRRGFNDGSGLTGLSVRYFRTGDYGFALIAHEIAHNWWGGTVSGGWLNPGTGGQWIVEGFAECSSLIATEAEFGAEALARRMATEFFDPARQQSVADMSVLDNVLNEPVARDTIYRKGAYVAAMLRHMLGDDVAFRAWRQFAERFRYQHATDHDVQQVFEEVSQQSLERYFADWVRSDQLADLSLDASSAGEVVVSNAGKAAIAGAIDLWSFNKAGGEPARRTVQLGDRVAVDGDTDFLVLDPTLVWADVQRENNRYPRRDDPVAVSVSARGDIAIVRGAASPWGRSAVASLDGSGRVLHTWELDRGLMQAPLWSADASQLIVSSSEKEGPLPAIVTLAADGARRTVGHATAPAPADHGVVYAAVDDRIVRFAANGTESIVVQRHGESLDQPLPSPDRALILFTAARGNHLTVHVVNADGGEDREVVASDRDRVLFRWAPDGKRVYAVIGGTWDWQVWEISGFEPHPAGAASGDPTTEPVRVLVHDAAAIADLAVSPDSKHLAFTAAASLDYPRNQRGLFVMDLDAKTVEQIEIPDVDLTSVAWANSNSLLVVATDASPNQPWLLPERRTLRRVELATHRVEAWNP